MAKSFADLGSKKDTPEKKVVIPEGTRGIVPKAPMDDLNEFNARLSRLEKTLMLVDDLTASKQLTQLKLTDQENALLEIKNAAIALDDHIDQLCDDITMLKARPLAVKELKLPSATELEEFIMDETNHTYKDVKMWYRQLSKYGKHRTLESALNVIELMLRKQSNTA